MKINLQMSKKMGAKDFELSEAASSHPNKAPFKCALFAVDTPSDGSPSGAGGKKIRIASSVCDQHLDTFVGMAFNIDYTNGMSDHDPRFKVAVIEKAYRALDGYAWVEGYIYAKDFPDVVATIRYYNNLASEHDWREFQFGASLEMEAAVRDAEDMENVLDVLEFCGTGAAILFAEQAAYKTTSFAAKKEEDTQMNEEQLKQIISTLMKEATADIKASMDTAIQKVETQMSELKTEVDTLVSAKTEETQKTALELAEERAAKAEQELAALKAAASEPTRKTISAAESIAKYGVASEQVSDYRSFCAAVDQLNLSASESIKLKMQARQELKEEGTK